MIGPSGNVQVYLACGVTDSKRCLDRSGSACDC